MEDYPGNPGILPGNSGTQEFYQEIREFRIPTRKLRKLEFLAGNQGVQESYQEIQDLPGILAGISGIQDSCQEIQDLSGSQTRGIHILFSGATRSNFSIISIELGKS